MARSRNPIMIGKNKVIYGTTMNGGRRLRFAAPCSSCRNNEFHREALDRRRPQKAAPVSYS